MLAISRELAVRCRKEGVWQSIHNGISPQQFSGMTMLFKMLMV